MDKVPAFVIGDSVRVIEAGNFYQGRKAYVTAVEMFFDTVQPLRRFPVYTVAVLTRGGSVSQAVRENNIEAYA